MLYIFILSNFTVDRNFLKIDAPDTGLLDICLRISVIFEYRSWISGLAGYSDSGVDNYISISELELPFFWLEPKLLRGAALV